MNFRKMAEEMRAHSLEVKETPTTLSKKEKQERRAAYRASQKRHTMNMSGPRSANTTHYNNGKKVDTPVADLSVGKSTDPNNTPISIDEESAIDILSRPWTGTDEKTDIIVERIRDFNRGPMGDDFC
jgi:hypothetical protein